MTTSSDRLKPFPEDLKKRHEERLRIRAAARVLCRVTCPTYPCLTCSPGSHTWDLATDTLDAADKVSREWTVQDDKVAPQSTVAEFRGQVEEAIIREINDPRNAGMSADFRDGLRVARVILNKRAQDIGAYPDPTPAPPMAE